MAESATSQNSSHKRIEDRLPVVREQNGIFTELPVIIDNNLTVNGTITGGSTTDTMTNLAVTTLASIQNLTVSGTFTPAVSSYTNLVVSTVASVNFLAGTTIDFAAAAITACGATTAILAPNMVGGTNAPTAGAQYGWAKVQVAGTSAWIPIWH